jgi:hypothetical protein
MNIADFFIRRPIFAAVLSIATVIVGGIAAFTLPVAQYPDVTPPTVVVTARYPGSKPIRGGEDGSHADRATGERRRKHALHVEPVHQRWNNDAHDHV